MRRVEVPAAALRTAGAAFRARGLVLFHRRRFRWSLAKLPASLCDSALRRESVIDNFEFSTGRLRLPTRPGLGIELNRDALEQFRRLAEASDGRPLMVHPAKPPRPSHSDAELRRV